MLPWKQSQGHISQGQQRSLDGPSNQLIMRPTNKKDGRLLFPGLLSVVCYVYTLDTVYLRHQQFLRCRRHVGPLKWGTTESM